MDNDPNQQEPIPASPDITRREWLLRLGGQLAQLGRILPQRLRPGFFVFDRGKNLGGDRVLFVFRKLADSPERILE